MAETEISLELLAALRSVADLLDFTWEDNPPIWMLGGSCGLLLHGVALGRKPQDIDLYADMGAAERLHEAMSAYAVDNPVEDRSNGCYSLLSHYRIGGMSVELVCGFQIYRGLSRYSVETVRLLRHASLQVIPEIGMLRLMPLAHELVFNILRSRADRYKAISSVMRMDMPRHLPPLQELIQHHQWGPSHMSVLEGQLDITRANA
ncbi:MULTISPECIES: hypothetical protein [unclassified Paenibacillus]|uniref:hypothetical protein n=1 Tax=unclassified Paenibacillus TaxID=185978 RepID=UPI0036C8128C